MKLVALYPLALSALILAACTNAPPSVQRTDRDIARLMATDDNVIVPGERIGPVFLGMTDADLYKKFGNPLESKQTGTGFAAYFYSTFMVYVGVSTHKVASITTPVGSTAGYSGYATREGIKVGSSALEVQAKLPQSTLNLDSPAPGYSRYNYQTGMVLSLDPSGKVVNIEVIPAY
jgi:hypothetical protein